MHVYEPSASYGNVRREILIRLSNTVDYIDFSTEPLHSSNCCKLSRAVHRESLGNARDRDMYVNISR